MTIVVVACRAGGASDTVAVAILVTYFVGLPPKATLFPFLAQNHTPMKSREGFSVDFASARSELR
jgi:hypothetical protein